MSSADRADSASVSASPSAESPRDEEGFSTQQRYALDLQRQIIEQSHRRDRERRAFRDRSATEDKVPWRAEDEDLARRKKQQHAEALRAQVEEKRRQRELEAERRGEEERRENERVQRERDQIHSRYLSEKGLRQPAARHAAQPAPDEREERRAERQPGPRSVDDARGFDTKLLMHLAAQVDRLVADSEALKEQVAQVANQQPIYSSSSSNAHAPPVAKQSQPTLHHRESHDTLARSNGTVDSRRSAERDAVDLLAGSSSWAPAPIPTGHPVAAVRRRGIPKPQHRSAMLDELEHRSQERAMPLFAT